MSKSIKKGEIDVNKMRFWMVVLIIFSILGGTLLLTITTNNVFLPQTADFVNFAKSMLHGRVLYTDLVDHKGLYLYIPYLIAQTISMTSSIPVMLMEIGAFIWMVFSALSFFKTQTKDPIIAIKRTLIFLITFVLWTLNKGFSMLLSEGILSIIIFFVFKYLHHISTDGSIKKAHVFGWGCIVGYFLFNKYSLVLVFLPLFWVFLSELIRRKESIQNILKMAFYAVLGLVLISIPAIGYCIYHDNLDNFFYFMRIVLEGNHAEITLAQAPILLVTGFFSMILAGWTQIKRDITTRNVALTVSMFLFNAISLHSFDLVSFFAYTTVFFIPMIFCIVPIGSIWNNKERRNIAFLLAYLTIAINLPVIIGGSIISKTQKYLSIKEVAEMWDIDNSNILYIGNEDGGYGIWKEEPSSIQFQWMPGRFSGTEIDKMILQRNILLVEGKEFDYISYMYVPGSEYSNKDDEYVELIHLLHEAIRNNYQQHYEYIYKKIEG